MQGFGWPQPLSRQWEKINRVHLLKNSLWLLFLISQDTFELIFYKGVGVMWTSYNNMYTIISPYAKNVRPIAPHWVRQKKKNQKNMKKLVKKIRLLHVHNLGGNLLKTVTRNIHVESTSLFTYHNIITYLYIIIIHVVIIILCTATWRVHVHGRRDDLLQYSSPLESTCKYYHHVGGQGRGCERSGGFLVAAAG